MSFFRFSCQFIMLLRQTFQVRSKLAQIRYPQLRVLFSTTHYSSEKKTYAVRGQDEIVRGTFKEIQENVSVFDHVTSKFPANQEKVALVGIFNFFLFH